jgi:membrane-associated phospholipid phosphatase
MRPPHWRIEPEIPLPRLRTISRLWACAAVLGAAGVAALAVDVPLAVWADRGSCPSIVQKLCGLSETFAHGAGVALVLACIAVLDPWHRYALPRIAAAALGSGLLANALKLLVARARPHHFDLQTDALDSFVGWFPMLGNSSWQQGFPSSHAATAAGLAVALSCLYPRGRWLFPTLAALAGFQRVLAGSHFLSDVFWGAAVGCIFSPLCIYGSRLSRAFDRLEERLVNPSAPLAQRLGPRRPAPRRSCSSSPSDDVPRAA